MNEMEIEKVEMLARSSRMDPLEANDLLWRLIAEARERLRRRANSSEKRA